MYAKKNFCKSKISNNFGGFFVFFGAFSVQPGDLSEILRASAQQSASTTERFSFVTPAETRKNFASFGITKLLLRPHMDPEEAREVLGATCSLTEDKVKVWYVKMPDLKQAAIEMPDIVSPDLHWLADEEADLNDYLKDPTNPVVCLPAQDNPLYWLIREQCAESRYGEPGSTRNF